MLLIVLNYNINFLVAFIIKYFSRCKELHCAICSLQEKNPQSTALQSKQKINSLKVFLVFLLHKAGNY
jgi:hypothetical protein